MAAAIDQFLLPEKWWTSERLDGDLSALLQGALNQPENTGDTISTSEDAWGKVFDQIMHVVSRPSEFSEPHSAGAVWQTLYLPASMRGDAIEAGLSHPNPKVAEISAWQIPHVEQPRQLGLAQKAMRVGRRAALAAYCAIPMMDIPEEIKLEANDEIVTAYQLVSGNLEPEIDMGEYIPAGTAGIGKRLGDGQIERPIGRESLAAWRHLLTDVDWESRGFDRPPIEPILKVEKIGPQAGFMVTSGVLRGRNLNDTLPFYDPVTQRSIGQRYLTVLDAMSGASVVHGHPHPKNILLVPQRQSNGLPILESDPELVVIDFDKARFKGVSS